MGITLSKKESDDFNYRLNYHNFEQRVFMQGNVFGGHHYSSTLSVGVTPQNPNFRAEIGISSLNIESINLRTERSFRNICSSYNADLKVKGQRFLFSDTNKSRTALLFQVVTLQVRMTSGKTYIAVAYNGLAPSHPHTAASIFTYRPCSHTDDVDLRPRLVYQFVEPEDESLGWP
jgi:hypothetical protein